MDNLIENKGFKEFLFSLGFEEVTYHGETPSLEKYIHDHYLVLSTFPYNDVKLWDIPLKWEKPDDIINLLQILERGKSYEYEDIFE